MNYSDRELALIADTNVLGYIRARRAELDAQAKAEGWQFWAGPCDSLADDYDNVYEYLHCGACGTYSDYYKDLHGIRPRWVRTSKMRLEEVEALITELDTWAEAEIERRAEEEEAYQAQMAAMQAEMDEQQDLQDWNNGEGMLFAIQDRLMGHV